MMMLMSMAVLVTAAVVVMGMIMAVIVTAACAFILGIGQEIEKPQHHHADAADEHQRTKESIRRQIARHAPADVKVEHHATPENEEQHAEQMNEESLCFHEDENGGLNEMTNYLTTAAAALGWICSIKVVHGRAKQATRMNMMAHSQITNFLRKTAEYMKTNFTSSIGPKTRKASFAALEKAAIGAAMNASEVLHNASTKASPISEGTAVQSVPATNSTFA